MYMAQNATAHTLLQTSQSLSVDEYSADKLGNDGLASVGDFLNALLERVFDGDEYASYTSCHEGAVVDQDGVKSRFVGYLTGEMRMRR
mgnify:CR=1 FL=1